MVALGYINFKLPRRRDYNILTFKIMQPGSHTNYIIKDHLCVLLPIITRIVNLSLASLFPSSLKKSIITPLLKKPSLDPEVINHYRPVSNLSFISKVIEKAVAHQLNDHLLANNLYETYQSAYHEPLHSTETALLMVQNDILIINNKTFYIAYISINP